MPGGFCKISTSAFFTLKNIESRDKIAQNILNMYFTTLGSWSSGNGDSLLMLILGSDNNSWFGFDSTYPQTSTKWPLSARLWQWFCIRGLRPMSPNTTTHTLFVLAGFLSLICCPVVFLLCKSKKFCFGSKQRFKRSFWIIDYSVRCGWSWNYNVKKIKTKKFSTKNYDFSQQTNK